MKKWFWRTRKLIFSFSWSYIFTDNHHFLFERGGPNTSEPSTTPFAFLELCLHTILCIQDQFELFKECSPFAQYQFPSLFLFPPHHPWGSTMLQTHLERHQWPRKEIWTDADFGSQWRSVLTFNSLWGQKCALFERDHQFWHWHWHSRGVSKTSD